MDVIYDAVTDYLQAMIMTDGVDVKKFTEFDRLFCLMVFFQMSFYREPFEVKCPHCGVDVQYRYDMSRYLAKLPDAYVDDQVVDIPFKSMNYEFTLGWPTVGEVSKLMQLFYGSGETITEEMERTQFGINYVMAFVKRIRVFNRMNLDEPRIDLDLTTMDDFQSRFECLNEIPSLVTLDDSKGMFSKVTGFFLNRLENCFGYETCPQCHKETDYGLPQSVMFYGMFYGSLKSLYGFILQVECLMVFRYDCCIFDKEQFMTFNDLQQLVHQLGTTMEKDNKERQRINKDNLTKGLWYIREILNTLVFPEDRKHSGH